MNKCILIFYLLIISIKIFATDQFDDLLIIGKDTFNINSPIDLDSTDKDFIKIWYDNVVDKKCFNTACWRRAICQWVINGDSLYLVKMTSCCTNKEITLAKLEKAKNKIFARWISGSLYYSSGRLLCTNDRVSHFNDLYNIFEYDNILQIQDGKVVKNKKYSNTNSIIGKYKTNEEILNEINKKLDQIANSGQLIEFDITFKSNEAGHLIDLQVENLLDTSFLNDINLILKDFNGLPVLYKYGKKIDIKYDGHCVIYK